MGTEKSVATPVPHLALLLSDASIENIIFED